MSNNSDGGGLRKEFKLIYTPLEVAKKEIWKRWRNKELKSKIEKYLGNDLPPFLRGKPKAILGRNIASPNNEFFDFKKLSKKIGLGYEIIEYLDDKAVWKNKDKYYLIKMYFCDGKGRNGGKKISVCRAVDVGKAEGKKFSELKTFWGESFSDFHHSLFKNYSVDNIEKNAHDLSTWFEKRGKIAKLYYKYYLSLFVCHGVLFENYVMNKKDVPFTKNIVIKNFKSIQKKFGVKPLIVPIYQTNEESYIHASYYKLNKV